VSGVAPCQDPLASFLVIFSLILSSRLPIFDLNSQVFVTTSGQSLESNCFNVVT